MMISATSVAYKPVEIWSMTATASSLLFAFTFAISAIIAETYGKDKSFFLVNQIITCGLIFSIVVSLIPSLPSPSSWHHQAAYDYVFGHSFRFAIIGTIASWFSYRINIYFITKWKILTRGKYLPLRIIGSNTIGEFFLVLTVTFGAFYPFFPLKTVVSMFIFAYLSKIIYALLLAWPSAFIAEILKKKEGINVLDL